MRDDLDNFELELRRLPPSAVPQDLMARLRAAQAEPMPSRRLAPPKELRWTDWLAGWRGLAWVLPAAAAMLIWLAWHPAVGPGRAGLAEAHGIKADAVRVDHSLIASFDTVAQLPDGEPVRFRCREWHDDLVVKDEANGVFITQSTPRVEVVPVRFETY